MPESPAQWVPLAAIPVLLVVGSLAVLHWSRYLGALGRLHRAQTSPGAAPAPHTAAWLELRSAEHYRRAYRLTWAVAVVLAVGLAAAVLAG
ncbi:hypothetical protein ACH9D2_08165 [Kocuria sp. M4R2S49]|uniref:hypothetical protein n=1 Tax=Kocuria rhizosphaericola TaxID=3376284 RepID=UPI00378F7C8F